MIYENYDKNGNKELEPIDWSGRNNYDSEGNKILDCPFITKKNMETLENYLQDAKEFLDAKEMLWWMRKSKTYSDSEILDQLNKVREMSLKLSDNI